MAAEKYAKLGIGLKGMDWSVPYGCLLRHLDAWYRGEDNDPESGLPHLGHAMCNLVMLAHYAEHYAEGDDRPAEFFNNRYSRQDLTLRRSPLSGERGLRGRGSSASSIHEEASDETEAFGISRDVLEPLCKSEQDRPHG